MDAKNAQGGDELMYEIEDGHILMPIQKMDQSGIYQSKVFRVSEVFFNLLMVHQKKALGWLLEQHVARQGAFLADEMGLGKTISAISLLVTLTTTYKHDLEARDCISDSSKIDDPVLIVCPATVI